jgi:hypothetical protein
MGFALVFLDAQFLQEIRIRHKLSLPAPAGSSMPHTMLERPIRRQGAPSGIGSDSCHPGPETGPLYRLAAGEKS